MQPSPWTGRLCECVLEGCAGIGVQNRGQIRPQSELVFSVVAEGVKVLA
jgi:hypothetical protein